MKNKKAWFIIGATSTIAKAFCQLLAQQGYTLYLVARDNDELQLMANDLRLRHGSDCHTILLDLKENDALLHALQQCPHEYSLLLAASINCANSALTNAAITEMLQVNVISLSQIIHTYWHTEQSQHQILFLSSVAACRGRGKNSLYGGSKATIEVYLEGLQQTAKPGQHISIARLGFIDTPQTYGQTGVFHAASPQDCAKACLLALAKGKRFFYFPFFWRYILLIIKKIPHAIYKKLNF